MSTSTTTVSHISVFDESLAASARQATNVTAVAGLRNGHDESFTVIAAERQTATTPIRSRSGADESFAEFVAASSRTAATTPSSRLDDGLGDTTIITARRCITTPVATSADTEESPLHWLSTPCCPHFQQSSSSRQGKMRLRKLEESSCSSLSTSRRVLSEINSQARFEALHRDGECRKKKLEIARREKERRLDEEARELQNHRPPPQRPWGRKWAEDQSASYAKKLQNLEDF